MSAKATVFEFTSYTFEPGNLPAGRQESQVVFKYKTEFADREPIVWTETIILPEIPRCPTPVKLLESLHIILGISYWKFYCATNLRLPYALSKWETDFWNVVYKKGLGEFFYKNKLDPKISPKFPYQKNRKTNNYQLTTKNSKNQRFLVGIGGGKDSIVSAELLKQAGFDFTSFNIETHSTRSGQAGKSSDIVNKVIETIGMGNLKIQRHLDWQVRQSHQYNGHIPISAIYAFLGIFACILYEYDYFIVSNEHSSNFGNITYKGLEVNHQWSKSFEFETLFSDYVKKYISPNVKYFSLLRPFYEIRIVKMFAKLGQKYFSTFCSCNKGHWCGQCAKCVFAFTMLSAFLSRKELLKIFGKDLSADESLQPLFMDISGQGSMKPFDCVGTFEEVQEALGIKKPASSAGRHPEVWQTQKENAVPEEFKFLGMETVQIVRQEGIEGQATKKFLKKYYPKLKIVKENADITIKTPGVNKGQIPGYYTTPTNIFFSFIRRRASDNLIIGVTGSKGKSTTASLIYHMLKTARKDAELLGNIGIPMIDRLVEPIFKDTIFVLELSSFQLDDIRFSPDIAVITSLFPEHLDYHGSLKNYYAAKENIVNFQNPGDHVVRDVKPAQKYESNLLGEHNQRNIASAVAVAEILEIPPGKITEAIKSFKGLPHRLERVEEFKGITFYDDAISTTPESTIMAIKALRNVDTIFLGGQDRGYDFKVLEEVIVRHKIRNIVLFPDSGPKMLKSTKGLKILRTKSMQAAVKFAYKHTKEGSVCLLSCASPSYSLWKNFEEKGEQFKKFVKKFS